MEITTNQLSLTGVIMENPQFDHEVFGEAFFRTVLSVPRLSGAFDLLPLTISERLMGEDFQQGATVAIGGQLRSYNKVMGGAGRLLLTAFAQHLRPVDEEENPNTVFLSGALCKPPSPQRACEHQGFHPPRHAPSCPTSCRVMHCRRLVGFLHGSLP